MVIQDLKERLVDGKIKSYVWILTGLMWGDAHNKEMGMHKDMQELLGEGNVSLVNNRINKV